MSPGLVLDVVAWSLAVTALSALLVTRWKIERRMAMVAEASHELRGPLTAVGLGLALIARGAEPDGARRAAALDLELRRAGLALADLAEVPAGRRVPDAAVLVDVGDLLTSVSEAWAIVAGAFGRPLELEAPAERWLVRGDPVRLSQAVGNLVANAIEHGEGPIRLRARALDATVRIEVLDAGGGLPGPLQAGGHTTARRGHGLAVAGRVAARCGGRLSSERVAGGHVMALELPA